MYQDPDNESQLAQTKPSQHAVLFYVQIFAYVSSLSQNNAKEGLLSNH